MLRFGMVQQGGLAPATYIIDFPVGTTNWNLPANLIEVIFEGYGAGGSGGGASGNSGGQYGGGAGAGSYSKKTISEFTDVIYYRIYVPDTTAGNSAANGSVGADATVKTNGITSICIAKGGGAGLLNGTAGSYQSGSIGDITYHGGNGSAGVTFPDNYSGAGGGSAGNSGNGGNASGITKGAAGTDSNLLSGSGGNGLISINNGNNGANYGGGGGGALSTNSLKPKSGGPGGRGWVRLTYTVLE